MMKRRGALADQRYRLPLCVYMRRFVEYANKNFSEWNRPTHAQIRHGIIYSIYFAMIGAAVSRLLNSNYRCIYGILNLETFCERGEEEIYCLKLKDRRYGV